jgi:hypothetical protein
MTIAPQIDSTTGLLLAARQVLSPHWDARPRGVLPDLIVVHGISLPPGQFGGPWIDRLFCGNLPPSADPSFAAIASLRVSAHGVIDREGNTSQYVPGMPGNRVIAADLHAMISRSALSSKEPMTCHTHGLNTRRWPL